MKEIQAERYVKKFFKKYTTENLNRVYIKCKDWDKMGEMIEFLNKENPDFNFSINPAIGDALYAIVKSGENKKIIGVDGMRLDYDKDGQYFKFMLFRTSLTGDSPEKSVLDFTIDKSSINMEYIDGGYSHENLTDDKVKGYIKYEDITIIKNIERLPDKKCYELAIDTFQTWLIINHFLIYHEKDILISEYKYQKQNKGIKERKSKPIILGKMYKTNLPENWKPVNQKNYWKDSWFQKSYIRTITVKGPYQEFIKRQKHNLKEDDFESMEYKLIESDGLGEKVKVQHRVKEVLEMKRRLPLAEGASYAKKSERTYKTS
tara:strand:- start:57 stop:1010 length:954 start_codon:yes stop_codon:yes gene_type:complete